MSPTKQTLYSLLDNVDISEYDLVYKLLLKFIPVDEIRQDELQAFLETKKETEFISHSDINWN